MREIAERVEKGRGSLREEGERASLSAEGV